MNVCHYGVLWTADKIAWYVDAIEAAETPNPGLTHPVYLLIAIAVGGPWGGNPDAATRFPARLVIDHIRAYQLNSGPKRPAAGRND
jgi:beta-glucanase (GH16 family)